jgi:hypothetical protein
MCLTWSRTHGLQVFVVDIVPNFITPVQDIARVWVTEPFRIARTYLGGWFTIDIVSIVPFDIIASFGNNR